MQGRDKEGAALVRSLEMRPEGSLNRFAHVEPRSYLNVTPDKTRHMYITSPSSDCL